MPNIRYLFSITLVFAGFCLLPGVAQATETFHTCNGFIDSVPATITKQGVWCMRKDLSTANTSGNIITINANNVAIDCNNFKFGGLAAGNASLARAIRAEDRQNVTVRNCNIRGFDRGVWISGGAGHLIEDNRFDNSLYSGIFISGTENALVQRNRVFDTGGAPGFNGVAVGIIVSGHAIDNVISGVSGGWGSADAGPSGIYVSGYGSVVRGNRISGLEVTGQGLARGIRINPYRTSQVIVDDNHIAAYGTPRGSGVDAREDSICINNVVMGFQAAYSGCSVMVNNH